jgi:hypothetical protein
VKLRCISSRVATIFAIRAIVRLPLSLEPEERETIPADMSRRGAAAINGQPRSQPQTDDRMNRIYRMDSALGRHLRQSFQANPATSSIVSIRRESGVNMESQNRLFGAGAPPPRTSCETGRGRPISMYDFGFVPSD